MKFNGLKKLRPIARKRKLEELQQIATDRGGELVSAKYIDTHSLLRWSCFNGHTWKASAANIRRGLWCPVCRIGVRLTPKIVRPIAKQNGGFLIAKAIPNNQVKVEWQCCKNHIFLMSAGAVKAGRWCPRCAHNAQHTIEEMKALAISRGGRCLSKTYKSNRKKLRWQCNKKHRWSSSPDSVLAGTWCPECADATRFGRDTTPGTIEKMQAVAKLKGGRCLSKRYVNNRTHLLWECKKGHTWKAAPSRVCCAGSWCPKCSGREKLTIAEMQKIAQANGGQCLSTTYVNNSTHLRWRCAEGHTWKAQPYHIKNGTWCPTCAKLPHPYVKKAA